MNQNKQNTPIKSKDLFDNNSFKELKKELREVTQLAEKAQSTLEKIKKNPLFPDEKPSWTEEELNQILQLHFSDFDSDNFIEDLKKCFPK